MNKIELCKKISETSDRIEELESELADCEKSKTDCEKELASERTKLRLLIQDLDVTESINDVDVDENP